MKAKYIIILCTLFLVSCSSVQKPSQDINKTPSGSVSGNVSATGGSQVSSGSIQNPQNIVSVSVGADETKDVTLDLKDNKGALKIDYGTGARVNVHFTSEGKKTLNVKVQTPLDVNGNIRITQIIFPDGTSDGPFGRDQSFNLTQSGSYQIVLSANMMAGDRWSGEVDLNLEIK